MGAATSRPIGASASAIGQVVDMVRDAHARRTTLRIVGGGRWLDAGRPVRADARLPVSHLTGITEYVPGDLTLTALAGTSLGDIARATAEHGQWLTLDPFGDDDGTLGATVATASCGPLATSFGTPRDIVLGIEFVTGTGAVVRAGGRVVKNVAGFDLVRLVIGAWGTLGAVTEITVRLRARPEVDATVAVALGPSADDTATLTARLRALPFTPFAAELLSETLATDLGLEPRQTLLFRLGGSEDAARAYRAALRPFGELHDRPDEIWSTLRRGEPARSVVVRLSRQPSRFAETWDGARTLTQSFAGALVHGSPLRGVVRCMIPETGGPADFASRLARGFANPFDGSRVFERLPASAWQVLAPTATRDRLSRGIKAAYDPDCLLNPGILGDCIRR